MSKTDLPFRFCKIGLRNTYLFLAKKWSFVVRFFCFILFCFILFCCNFVQFWLTFLKNPFKRAKFCSLESEIERGRMAEKNVVCRFVCLFVAALSDFGLPFL